MGDDGGFLSAIREAPGDDTTRLVYADWLDEQRLPGGEFLRVECRLSALGPADHDRRTRLLEELRLASRGLDRDWMAAVGRVPLVEIGLRWTTAGAGPERPSRDQAYRDILHRGLVMVRSLAHAGRSELCRIEADHLHNIPTLLDEPGESRHVFYVVHERGLYMDRLRQSGEAEYLEQVTIWYSEPWWVLACAAGVTDAE